MNKHRSSRLREDVHQLVGLAEANSKVLVKVGDYFPLAPGSREQDHMFHAAESLRGPFPISNVMLEAGDAPLLVTPSFKVLHQQSL